MRIRTDLDGRRVRAPSGGEVWLMFHGMRHFITGPAAYDALFSDIDVIDVPDIGTVMRGPDLVEETALIRGGDGQIFLVTAVSPNEVRRFHIVDWATFEALGFNIALVRDVPDIVISAVTCAPPIFIAAKAHGTAFGPAHGTTLGAEGDA